METQPVPICAGCGTPGALAYADLDDALFGAEGRWTFRRCPNRDCGMLWLDPAPTAGAAGQAYARYFTHGDGDSRSPLSVPRRAFRLAYRRLFMPLVATVAGARDERRRLDRWNLDEGTGRVLEVGCGDGSRLARLRPYGWEVSGLDVDPASVRIARARHGLAVHLGPLETAPYEADSFEIVVSNHVMEHVHEPLAMLRQIRALLRPGGQVVAVTPNVLSLGHARFGEHWSGLDPSRHLQLFSPHALEALARAAGFARVRVQTTAARAHPVARMSLYIADQRARRLLGWTDRVAREIESVRFQREAVRVHQQDPQSGEECVLHATKDR